ncbi:MAG: hypothetical protein AB3N13_03885 [Arenibacterium sp.]
MVAGSSPAGPTKLPHIQIDETNAPYALEWRSKGLQHPMGALCCRVAQFDCLFCFKIWSSMMRFGFAVMVVWTFTILMPQGADVISTERRFADEQQKFTDKRLVATEKMGKKKKKKKKGPKSSVSVNSNGAKVKVAGDDGAVSVGPNGPSVSVRPNGGPVRIGVGANGKPKFSYHFRGGR